MLVDNGVLGDSRVQKVARSAADAGWSVTLLGRSLNGQPQRWWLGDAEVRLLPMPDPLARQSVLRRAVLRRLIPRQAGARGPHRATARGRSGT